MDGLTNVSDEKLVAEVKSGSREAFVELVDRYQPRIYRLAYRMLSDHSSAEDVTQETFLRVYDKLETFRASRKFSSWIYRIGTNLCIDLLRKQGRVQLESTDHPVPGTDDLYRQLEAVDPSPDSLAVRDRLGARIQCLVAELPPKYRAVVVLRYAEQLQYREIAATLKLPLGTVKTRLYRARETLRAKIEADPGLRSVVNELLDECVLPKAGEQSGYSREGKA